MSSGLQLLPAKYDLTLLASAARTAEIASTTQYNHDARGVILTLAVSAVTATPALSVNLQFSYDGGTTFVTVWTVAAAVATAVTSTYLIYPGILASADGAFTESVNLPLPRIWCVKVTVGDTDSATYALYGQLL